MRKATQWSYLFLIATPFLASAAVFRGLRVPGVRQGLGIVLFAAIALAVWRLGWRSGSARAEKNPLLATAGALLVTPFALIALLWVGLGTPWEATAHENEMRYLALAAFTLAEVAGFLLAKEALAEAGERLWAPLAVATILLAGPLYLVWDVYMFGLFSAKEFSGEVPTAFASFNEASDVLLFFAGALTYTAAALLAAALGRIGWLGPWQARLFVGASTAALLLLVHRGLAFIAPAALSAPWYTVPGFIVGIPAVPFIVPCLLGTVLLRRAGEP